VNLGWDRQRNEGILQRPGQGCVERLRGLEEPDLPLSVPTGVQLAPASPKLVHDQAAFSVIDRCS
jgi:hypothetical protein